MPPSWKGQFQKLVLVSVFLMWNRDKRSLCKFKLILLYLTSISMSKTEHKTVLYIKYYKNVRDSSHFFLKGQVRWLHRRNNNTAQKISKQSWYFHEGNMLTFFRMIFYQTTVFVEKVLIGWNSPFQKKR